MDKQTESRSQFEEWWGKAMNTQEMDLHWSDNWQAYSCHETNRAWLAWQASRESLVVEIASHTEFEIEHMISPEKEGYSLGWIDGRNYAARQVEKIGIRIKGEGDGTSS